MVHGIRGYPILMWTLSVLDRIEWQWLASHSVRTIQSCELSLAQERHQAGLSGLSPHCCHASSMCSHAVLLLWFCESAFSIYKAALGKDFRFLQPVFLG